jgi:hypothetical protein
MINSISALVSTEDRDQILTHTGPAGEMFVSRVLVSVYRSMLTLFSSFFQRKRYASRVTMVDVQSLHRGREEDREQLHVSIIPLDLCNPADHLSRTFPRCPGIAMRPHLRF